MGGHCWRRIRGGRTFNHSIHAWIGPRSFNRLTMVMVESITNNVRDGCRSVVDHHSVAGFSPGRLFNRPPPHKMGWD